MIIGITGTLAAGKGTIVEYLKKKGFGHYSVREFLIDEMKLRGMPINRDSMVIMANYLREKNSPSYIAEKIYERASQKGGDFIIESLRSVGEVEALRKKNDFYLFGVDADIEKRYERAMARGNETDHVSFEKFVSDEERELENLDPTKQNLKGCIERADFRFENNGTVEEFHGELEKALSLIRSKSNGSVGRKDYISWDDYFMGVAVLSSMRSKDPSTQVGACIVDPDKKIVGTGYNGAPRGIEDNSFPWAREGDFLETKYAYVCHAELNAILNSTKENLKECTIYVALFPCNECAKAIIQSGIKKVVYLSDKYKETPAHIASRKMLTTARVELVQLKSQSRSLKIDFDKV
jgi:dCMP deaminase